MSNGRLTPKLNITYSLLQFYLLGLFLLDFAVLFVRLDYLRVSGGSSYRVGTYCGYQTGKSVRVVGRIAVFKFVSNRVARYDGFTLSFIFTPKGKFNDASTVSYAFFFSAPLQYQDNIQVFCFGEPLPEHYTQLIHLIVTSRNVM